MHRRDFLFVILGIYLFFLSCLYLNAIPGHRTALEDAISAYQQSEK